MSDDLDAKLRALAVKRLGLVGRLVGEGMNMDGKAVGDALTTLEFRLRDDLREAAALALEDAVRLVDRFCTEHKIISNLGGELAPHPGGPQDVDLRAVGKELGIQLRARAKEVRGGS